MKFFMMLLWGLISATDVASQESIWKYPSNDWGRTLYLMVVGQTPCTVDFEDFIAFAQSFNTTPESPFWNVNADTNQDGVVNFPDFIAFAGVFGFSMDDESCARRYRQHIQISGQVVNGSDPVENVWVNAIKAEGASFVTSEKTDSSGYFSLFNLLEGDYHIVPKKFGYVFEPDTIKISLGDLSLNFEPFQGDLTLELIDVKVVHADIPIVGVEVSFLRAVAGQSAQGPWTGITDTSGVTAIRIPVLDGASTISGTYLTRVTNVNTGEVLDSWNSVPIQTADTRRLVLNVGGDAEYIPEREYFYYNGGSSKYLFSVSEERLKIVFRDHIDENAKVDFIEELGLRDDGDGLFTMTHTRGRSAILEAIHLAKRSGLVKMVLPDLYGIRDYFLSSSHLLIELKDGVTDTDIAQFLDEFNGTIVSKRSGNVYEVEAFDLLSQDLFEICERYHFHPLVVSIKPDQGFYIWRF